MDSDGARINREFLTCLETFRACDFDTAGSSFHGCRPRSGGLRQEVIAVACQCYYIPLA
jgi:hypothetical protein